METYLCDICGKKFVRPEKTDFPPTRLEITTAVYKDICPECEQAIRKMLLKIKICEGCGAELVLKVGK